MITFSVVLLSSIFIAINVFIIDTIVIIIIIHHHRQTISFHCRTQASHFYFLPSSAFSVQFRCSFFFENFLISTHWYGKRPPSGSFYENFFFPASHFLSACHDISYICVLYITSIEFCLCHIPCICYSIH